jgi:uncharacterized protein YbbC (DUF1343 family)
VNIIITDRLRFRPVATGIEIAVALRRLYPTQWEVDKYLRLLVNTDTLERLKKGASPEEITESWSGGLVEFQRARMRVLLYNN